MSKEKNINQEERFDENFRRSLETMRVEPAPRIWNRLSRQMLWQEIRQFNFSNVPGYAWVVTAMVAVIVGGGIWWLSSGDAGIQERESFLSSQPSASFSPDPVLLQPARTESPAPSSPAPSSSAPVKESSSAYLSRPVVTLASDVLPDLPSTHTAMTPSPGVSPAPDAVVVENLLRMAMLPFDLLTASGPQFIAPKPIVPNPKPVNIFTETRTTTTQKALPRSLQLGINITPDMVFYKSTSNYFKYNYTLDGGVQYNIGRFYLQSGVGIAWSSDIGNYAISANKNDSVGFYYSVVSFSESPGNPGHLEFTTSMNTVFDTNQYVYDYSTQNTYTYLEIPLVAGYRLVNRPKWSLGLDAGGFWSTLLSSKEPIPVFYVPEGRVTSVDNNTPGRRANSFGLLGSVRFEYIFAKRFSLLIAPSFKYHLNTIDENDVPGATQPWSIGLRAGIWYRFDLNK